MADAPLPDQQTKVVDDHGGTIESRVTETASSEHELAGSSSAASPQSKDLLVSSRGRKRKPKVFGSPTLAATDDSRPQKKQKRKGEGDTEKEYEKQWICAECKEAECSLNPDADILLVCEGTCRRVFHYPCVNLKSLPAEEEPFYCVDCKSHRHRCSMCHEYGDDGVEIFKCRRDNCGSFYHEGCLAVGNIDFAYEKDILSYFKANAAIDADAVEIDEAQLTGTPVFECPAHQCWTCAYIKHEDGAQVVVKAIKSKKKKAHASGALERKSGELFQCVECPRSYHRTCLPPTSRFHELAILCHDHAATCKLPDLDKASSLQQAIEDEIDQKFLDGKKKKVVFRRAAVGRNPFFLECLTHHRSKLESQFDEQAAKYNGAPPDAMFCLPVSIRDDVYSMPPTYRHIHVNKSDPNNAPPRPSRPDALPCQCTDKCLEDCLNRSTYVECTSKNCRVGPLCGNRAIGQRKVPKCKVKREQGKGWGLVVLEKAKRGTLIQEYVGELIDEAEKESRLRQWSSEHPNDPNFYIMENTAGWFIDARFTSNLSRFINHSCDPNCILSPIDVNGVMRNGIYALRDIEAGEFLSYDYNFETLHTDKFTCRCGAVKCRGSLRSSKLRKEADLIKTKSQLWDEAKAAYERDRKFLEDYDRDEVARCSQVAAAVPGCTTNDELVANGPCRQKYREEMLKSRTFLWRTVELGSNFVIKSIRLMRQKNES